MEKKAIDQLRKEYPNFVPVKVAASYLGMSARQLSKLVAEKREPYCLIGANISTTQKYTRIYTERLIAYLNGCDLDM